VLRSMRFRKVDFSSEASRLASARGGESLSHYINARTKLTWQCSRGHPWDALLNSVRSGSWCPTCARQLPDGLERAQAIAREKGGACTSWVYDGSHNKLSWQCKLGHRWKATLHSVINGSWCPECSLLPKDSTVSAEVAVKSSAITQTQALKRRVHNNKIKLAIARRIAEEQGGRCLSPAYSSGRVKLRFECADNHPFEMLLGRLRKGDWCPTCAKANVLPITNDLCGSATPLMAPANPTIPAKDSFVDYFGILETKGAKGDSRPQQELVCEQAEKVHRTVKAMAERVMISCKQDALKQGGAPQRQGEHVKKSE